ncbi:MAG: class I SAM-dependent methyltransferase [Candidatus Bathyarchaeota archaeon]|nr:class I SAM-dependent methyltransferase [Candidatus Bathyarchaeota archaeon]MDH5495322.1 class I SAM-dependent methyltransferase [Candidatus Bathyarchaeota archaeon]
MKVVTMVDELKTAKRQLYERLAEFMVGLVDFAGVLVVLEAGCGGGGLTIPLAASVGKKCKIIAYDLWVGSYTGDFEVLKEAIASGGSEDVVEAVRGDVKDMKAIADESVDLIVSNELFCDLDRTGLEQALKEFYRVLKHGGQMVHAELSPAAENRAQKLLIEADFHYSLEPILPEGAFWFSPTVDDVAVLMHKTGFKSICAHYSETNLRLGYEVAIEQLKLWKTDIRFVDKYEEDLQDYGLEFPLEHVVVCRKL